MADTYLIHRLNEMRKEGQLCDVHLVADDASTFPVHGLLLVAADENFYRFVVNSNNGPTVIKAGVSRPELESVVHFVYGVQSSGKQLEMGLQKLQMTSLLNQLSDMSKRSKVGNIDINAYVSSSTEVKRVINKKDTMGNICFKPLNFLSHNACTGDIKLHSPVKIEPERKSVVEPNPSDFGVSSSEHAETTSVKQTLPGNVKQEYSIEKTVNNLESNNSTFSDDIPMPSLLKCEIPKFIPSCSEERTMPTLERIECNTISHSKSARIPADSLFPVIVKSEPISPPESPVPKMLPPDTSGTILGNCRITYPELGYANQEVTCSEDHGLTHCFKQRAESQNDCSSCSSKLSTEDTSLSIFTSILPIIKTEEDRFEEISDQYTLLEDDMLILKDAQELSIANTSKAQIMQRNTSNIHSGKVIQFGANKFTDSNTFGTCTQFLDQSQNSAMGLPIIPTIPLYSPTGQSNSADSIIIQNPPGSLVTLVPPVVSNLPVNFFASELQQSVETNISNGQEQKCDARFDGMKQEIQISPEKNKSNSEVSSFGVYPGKVMQNMGSNSGRKKFSKIPMIMRRNSVPCRKRSYDSLKIIDVILHTNVDNTVEGEPMENTSPEGSIWAGNLSPSSYSASLIDGQLNQSFSSTQNDHNASSFVGFVAEKPKPKSPKQTKPKLFHGYSSFIPIAPKFEH